MHTKELHKIFLSCTGISTDTRDIKQGNLFFALKGDHFNGNAFAKTALEKGASYVVIDEEKFYRGDQTILVNDALKTLQKLAETHRKFLDLPIVALTGSNGKTTTKELIHAVLSKKYNTYATRGNLNNHIGVPLTLLGMTSKHEIGIVEMGANHQGEIKQLCAIAQPDYGYITNFGKAHLEGFGGVEGVIKGKSELYEHLEKSGGTLVLNLDDPLQARRLNTTNAFTFGQVDSVDLCISYAKAKTYAEICFNNTSIKSALMGKYNETNLAAAAAVGVLFHVSNVQIKEALESYTPSNNRSQVIKTGGQTVILDAYNANPTSMQAALSNLATIPAACKFAILGDMFELGKDSEKEHQFIVDYASNLNLDEIILIGKHFEKTKAPYLTYSSTDQFIEKGLSESIKKNLKTATVLIKGSRGMALERILSFLA